MKRTTLFSLALAAGLALSPSLANAQTKVTLTTAKAVGAELSFVTNPGKITVDWGDGTPVELTSTGEPITGELKGQTVSLSCDNLSLLDCSSNELTGLQFESASQLQVLYCFDNQITELSFLSCRNIQDLDCSGNQLATISLTPLQNLRLLNCAENQLKSLALTYQKQLQRLICSDNNITSLTLTANTLLETLWCQNNALTTLNLSSNRNLQSVVCDDNDITTVNVTNCTGLVDFWCDNNHLTSLNVRTNPGLQTLSCSNNQLTSLNIPAADSKNKTLAFYCDGNSLTYSSMHSISNIQNQENMLYLSQGEFALPKNQVMVDEQLTLDGFNLNADGEATSPQYVWKNGDAELVKGSKEDYVARSNMFTFNKPFESIYCEVTSSEYPGLVLSSTPLAVISEETGIQDVMDAYGFSYITNNGTITMKSGKPYQVTIYTVDGKQVWTGTVTQEERVSLGHGIFLVNGMKISL